MNLNTMLHKTKKKKIIVQHTRKKEAKTDKEKT
jgi:hypothetical protein